MKRYWKRYAANKAALVGLAILLVYLFLAVFADVFFDREMVTYQDYNAMMDGISADHWFGTDELWWVRRTAEAGVGWPRPLRS